jgi:hypothetical protein
MECFVACTGQAGISLVHLDIGITLLEVDQVVFTRHPGGHGVGYFIYLGCVSFWLYEAAEGFCVTHEAVFYVGGKRAGCNHTYLRYVCYP